MTTYTNPQPTKLYWSCTPAPVGMVMAWSARAIYNPNAASKYKGNDRVPSELGECVDLLPDRQQMVTADGKPIEDSTQESRLWKAVLEQEIIPALLQYLSNTAAPTGDSYDKIEISGDDSSYPWHLVATPNGSYGYMYISAWLMPEEAWSDEDDDKEVQA